ncbi:hypothetical protein [Allofustis seminis]|uniref:hypothetical protein n=1 Tax=Allofustis seminis TaxID=166939 RepID=UPI000364B953|nr:hypothetical protein [Allofustis seminis]
MTKKIEFWRGDYGLDPNIPSLHIQFERMDRMDTGEIELDSNVDAILFTRQNGKKIGGLELVNPQGFIDSPLTDKIKVNGHNVKELAVELLQKLKEG